MSVNLLEWHVRNLKNVGIHLTRKQEELRRLQDDISRIEKDIELREFQVASAIAEGKDSFDGDRYKVKK